MKRGSFLRTLIGLPLGIGTFLAQKIQQTDPVSHHLLNKFYVAGFQYYEGPELIHTISEGDVVEMQADTTNSYDKFAVAIRYNDTMIGHVPRSDNKHISRLLQQDVPLVCKVVESNPECETWEMLKVHIYL